VTAGPDENAALRFFGWIAAQQQSIECVAIGITVLLTPLSYINTYSNVFLPCMRTFVAMTATPKLQAPQEALQTPPAFPPRCQVHERSQSFELIEFMHHQRQESDLVEVLEQVSEMTIEPKSSATDTPQAPDGLGPRSLAFAQARLEENHDSGRPQHKRKPSMQFTPEDRTSSIHLRNYHLPSMRRKKTRSNSFLVRNAPRLPASPDLSVAEEGRRLQRHPPMFSSEYASTVEEERLPDRLAAPCLEALSPPPMPMIGSPMMGESPTVQMSGPAMLKMRKADSCLVFPP